MVLNRVRGAALIFALGAAVQPALADEYANPQLLRTVDELAALVETSSTDGAVS